MDAALDRLKDALADETAGPVHPSVTAAAEAVRARHHGAARAVLFYGSCLRHGGDAGADAVLDLYVLVERYRDAYGGWLASAANTLLPPNVFFVEVPWRGRTLRVKYAVMTLARFARGASKRSLQPMVWARFAQPARLVYVRDGETRAAVVAALADAVETMVGAVAPPSGGDTGAEALWMRAFAETYRAELRPEPPGQARRLFEADRERYERLTPWALAAGAARGGTPWPARRIAGRLLNLARLVKAVFTYQGALDYALWKVERHAGVHAEATPWQKRHPLLAAPVLAWRLYRLGAFR